VFFAGLLITFATGASFGWWIAAALVLAAVAGLSREVQRDSTALIIHPIRSGGAVARKAAS
jgi:hypothetical protein